MGQKLEDIQGAVTNADREKVLKLLRHVTGWKVYPSQGESFSRKVRAFELLEHLQTDESWLEPAKRFLIDVSGRWPELASGWVAL